MKKLIGIILAGFVLTACSLLPIPLGAVSNPLGPDQLATIEASYGVALAAAVAYRNLPLCKRSRPFSATNICAKRSIIVKLQAADRKAKTAIIAARAFTTEHPFLDASALIDAARQAVVYFRTIEVHYGVAQ